MHLYHTYIALCFEAYDWYFYPWKMVKGMFFYLCWFVCLFISNITEKCVNKFPLNFQYRSGMEQGLFWDRLFHSWLDYFTFLKLGMAQVCALGVLLVTYKLHIDRSHKKISISINSKLLWLFYHTCKAAMAFQHSSLWCHQETMAI